MLWYVIGIIALILIVILLEYKIKRPDQIVLFESKGKILRRKGKFFPRHFSLAIKATTHSSVLNIDAEAKGKLSLLVKLAITVSYSLDHIEELIKVGGWDKNAVSNTSREIEILLQGLVRGFTEKYEIEELTSDKLSQHLKSELADSIHKLGLEVISISIQSIEPTDKNIAEAIRNKEETRIREENEKENQKVRINAEKIKIDADEQIAVSKHELEIKKYELRKVEETNDAMLAKLRVEKELERKKMLLEVEREEISMLKDNPELLMLSPQVARLAEASQNLKNARTIVSLSPKEIEQGTKIIETFGSFLNNMINKTVTKTQENKKNEDQ